MLSLSEVEPSGAKWRRRYAARSRGSKRSQRIKDKSGATFASDIVLPNVVSRCVANDPRADVGLERFAERDLWNIGGGAIYSVLMLAARTTLAHFSVSSAMSSPKSAGEPESTVPPK